MTNADKLLFLENMTWQDVAVELEANTPLILPVGAIEQHGPHLPLGTDGIVHVEIAKRIAMKRRLIIAPPLWYGTFSNPKCGGGRDFIGSIGVTGLALEALFKDLISDLFKQGFRQLIVLNGHMENTAFLFEALDLSIEPYKETHKAIMLDWAFLLNDDEVKKIFPDGFPGWEVEHAGVVETSIMEVLKPELVRVGLKVDGGAERVLPYDIFPPPSSIIHPSGVLWKSTPANKEIGEFILQVVIERLLKIIDEEFEVEIF